VMAGFSQCGPGDSSRLRSPLNNASPSGGAFLWLRRHTTRIGWIG
jgi:hypothetical protein